MEEGSTTITTITVITMVTMVLGGGGGGGGGTEDHTGELWGQWTAVYAYFAFL